MQSEDKLKSVEPIAVWIVEDDDDYRQQLADLLDLDEGIVCQHTFGSFEKAAAALEQERVPPDLVLLDLNLPGTPGLEAIRAIRRDYPSILILVLTLSAHRRSVFEAIRNGAAGYLVKNDPYDDILRGVHQVMAGGAPLSSSIASFVLETFKSAPVHAAGGELTAREVEILRMLADGQARKEIAEQLVIATTTVDYHLRAIYEKLQVHSTAGAVGKALRKGLIE